MVSVKRRKNELLLPSPLEAVARATGALFEQRAIRQGAADDVDALAAVTGFDVEITARGDPLELLVGAGAAGVLDDARPIRGGGAGYVHALAAVLADDVEVA